MRGIVRVLLSAVMIAAAAVVGTLWLSERGEKLTSVPVSETSDTLIDKRDGRKYRTVVIGGNRWMAENLNYRPRWGRSWCYDKDESNCGKYGRLYDRKTAKTVCPSGWHLPSRLEWDDLAESAGGSSAAGKALKTKTGWNDYQSGGWNDFAGSGSGNGTDDYGFSALPGGVRTADDQSCRTGGYLDRYGPVGYCHAGDLGEWWTSSDEEFKSDPQTYTRSIDHGWDKVYEGADNDPRRAFSVRCTQDGNNAEEKEKQRIEALSEYFTDSRDGRVYRTVSIGANTWMAQNLDYKPKDGKSWCYGNNDSNCVKYGRLYDWNTAMAACPAGWHLPSSREWDILGQDVGGKVEQDYLRDVSDKLKAKNGWGRFGDGNDNYGFSALPGGLMLPPDGRRFDEVGAWAIWWTATKIESEGPYHRRMFAREDFMMEDSWDTDVALSVRCVRERSDILEWKRKSEEVQREREANRKKEEEKTKTLSTYFTDTRDGTKYRAVNIGGKTWMAENLNYTPKTGASWCYENDDSNCGKYGRLYDWPTAKNVCPSGWRLPSAQEWDSLTLAVGGEKKAEHEYFIWPGVAMLLKTTSGWESFKGKSGNGTDDHRFSAMPGGQRYSDGLFVDIGEDGDWWTATKNDGESAEYRMMKYNNDRVEAYHYDKGDALSVRCVKGSP